MTKNDIALEIGERLEDEGYTHFTATDVGDVIDDGYKVISLMAQCIEKQTTVSTVIGQPYYDFATLISDYYRVIAIYNAGTNRWLEPAAYVTLKEFGDRFECQQGSPRYWSPLGARHVALYPTPAASGVSLIVLYKAVGATLSSGDTPVIPASGHEALTDYALTELLDINLEYVKADGYYTKFLTRLGAIRKILSRRSWPDRLLSLARL